MAALVSGAPAHASVSSGRPRAIPPTAPDVRQAELQQLWAGFYDGWKDVPGLTPGTTMFMVPTSAGDPAAPADPTRPEMPEAVRGAVLFSLTSWNPLGQTAPMEANLQSYPNLLADLRGLRPRALWRSFGFDAAGNRENGCTVAFPAAEAAAARPRVRAVAERYGQGAVYEFAEVPGDATRLLRRTVPVLVPETEADVFVEICDRPELPMADPDLYFGAEDEK